MHTRDIFDIQQIKTETVHCFKFSKVVTLCNHSYVYYDLSVCKNVFSQWHVLKGKKTQQIQK